MNLFITDPKTQQPSVSVTLLVGSYILLALAVCLDLFWKRVESTLAMQLFSVSAALYFGRKAVPGKDGVTIEEVKNGNP